MPLGEVAEEVLKGAARLIGRIVFEIVFELIIQGPGYFLIRRVKPQSQPGEISCTLVGLLFWAVVIAAVCWVYYLFDSAAVV